jgi:hypothetical protein
MTASHAYATPSPGLPYTTLPDATAAPAQPGATGMDGLLPAHGGQGQLSDICATTPGGGWSDGFAISAARPTGSSCVAATRLTGGGRATRRWSCSTPPEYRSPVTATGATSSPLRQSRLTLDMNPWRAGCGASRTPGSGGGPGKRIGRKTDTAPPGRPTSEPMPSTSADVECKNRSTVTAADPVTRSTTSVPSRGCDRRRREVTGSGHFLFWTLIRPQACFLNWII